VAWYDDWTLFSRWSCCKCVPVYVLLWLRVTCPLHCKGVITNIIMLIGSYLGKLFLCVRQSRVIMRSTSPVINLSVHVLPNSLTQYFENKWTDFEEIWHKWSMGQGHKMHQLWRSWGQRSRSQEVKVRFEAWQRHRSQPCRVDYVCVKARL